MNIRAIVCCVLLLAFSATAQERVLVADGTKSQIGSFYLLEEEMKLVRSAIGLSTFQLPVPSGASTPCGPTDLEVKDVADGRFAARSGRAVLYWRCEKASDRLLSGIVVLAGRTVVAHFVFDFGSETKLGAVRDLDGNGSDELAIYGFSELSDSKVRSQVRIVEPSAAGAKKFGLFDVHSADAVRGDEFSFSAQRIFADPGPNFFAETLVLENAPLATVFDEKKLSAAGKHWRPSRDAMRLEPAPDVTNYVADSWRFRLTDIAAAVIAIASVLFILLVPVTIYAFFRSAAFRTARSKNKGKKDRANGPVAMPESAHLVPLNCPNCGAGTPLADPLRCPRCGAESPAPAEYSAIGKLRALASERLRRAESYLKWAKVLTSNSFVIATSILMVIVAASLLTLLITGGRGSLIFYRVFFATGLFGFGVLAAIYWLFALFLVVPIRSPRVRSILPEVAAVAGSEAGAAECTRCGGTVAFGDGAIGGICGYCGVETYRARVAWKIRNLSNEVNENATFSLIEAAEAYSEAVSNIVYTPLAIMLVMLIPAIACVAAGVFM